MIEKIELCNYYFISGRKSSEKKAKEKAEFESDFAALEKVNYLLRENI